MAKKKAKVRKTLIPCGKREQKGSVRIETSGATTTEARDRAINLLSLAIQEEAQNLWNSIRCIRKCPFKSEFQWRARTLPVMFRECFGPDGDRFCCVTAIAHITVTARCEKLTERIIRAN